MDHPWWTNGASSGFEQDNDYLPSCYDPNAFETQYEYICCNFCGDNHYIEQCPHVSSLDYVGDGFARVQTDWHDNSFNLSWNHEHSLPWDPNYSFPSYASHSQTSPNHVEEITPIHEKKPTIEDMFQRLLENENEISAKQEKNTLSLQNLALQMTEMASNLEVLKQKGVFIDISNDSYVEDAMGSENELSMVCNTFVGDCELEIKEGENNIECQIEVSILEPNLEIPAIYVQNPPTDSLTLTDGSQVDFIGFSKYLGASEDNVEAIELKPPMCHIASCTLKSLLIKGTCNSCMIEFPFLLKPCLLKRNEDKVIFVFDTYD